MAKRALDLIAASLGLVLLSPLLAAICLWIKLDSPGPVLHRGQRVGKDGRPFHILKFRTMVANAAKLGPGITVGVDPRITRAGRFLRRTKLDELPQLINVVRGEMSLVGPRPEDPRYVAYYTPEQRRVLGIRPGITSPASLIYRDESSLLAGANSEQVYISQILPKKLAIELEYLPRYGFWNDLGVIFRTVWAVVAR